MKKKLISVAVLAAMMAFSGTACADKKEKDEVAPEITGNKLSLSCEVGDTLNLLDGVSAIDDKDGDITSKIEVSIMPDDDFTAQNGSVTPTIDGEYEVTYSVSDKAGNKANAYSTLVVTPALGEKTEYKSYTFGAASECPFNTFFFGDEEGQEKGKVVGSAQNYKGNYRITATTVDSEAWHIKYHGNIETEAGADYAVIYKFKSNVAGKVKFGGNQEFDIKAGENEIEGKFTAGNAESYCELQLGMLPAFEIDILSVTVQKSVGEEQWESVVPQTFKMNDNGVVAAVFDNNSEGTSSATEDTATINITKGSDENGVWQTKLFIKTGIDLTPGKYKVSFDVNAQKAIDTFEVALNNGDTEKGVDCLYGQSVAAGETKTISWSGTVGTQKDDFTLQFQLGHANVQGDSNVVTVSNLQISVDNGNKEVTTTDYSFTPDGFGTYNDAGSGASGNLYAENGNLVYEMQSIGVTDWHNKMFIEKIMLESGKIYTFEFEAKADKNISCAWFLNVYGDWDARLSEQCDFTTEYKKFSFTTTAVFAADMNFEVLWQFGSNENAQLGGAKIEFKSMKIYAQDAQG